MKIVRIPSKLYSDLYELGGDKLVAIFCILKHCKNKQTKYQAFQSKNGKFVQGIALLRYHTGISIERLQTSFAMLDSKMLAQIEENGDVWIIGNNTAKALYESDKMIPIEIGKSISETSLNSYYVRIHSSAKNQSKLIAKKTKRSELINLTNNPKSLNDFRKGKIASKKYGKVELTPTIVLSNKSYSSTKGSETVNQKLNGNYWKSRLRKSGKIISNRRYQQITEMTISCYQSMKNANCFPKNYTYQNGFLCKELACELILK